MDTLTSPFTPDEAMHLVWDQGLRRISADELLDAAEGRAVAALAAADCGEEWATVCPLLWRGTPRDLLAAVRASRERLRLWAGALRHDGHDEEATRVESARETLWTVLGDQDLAESLRAPGATVGDCGLALACAVERSLWLRERWAVPSAETSV